MFRCNNLLFGIIFSTLVISACSSSVKLTNEFEASLSKIAIKNNFNGVILLADKDSILFEEAFGFSNFEKKQLNSLTTIFNIASLTKHITAAGILLLEEKGQLKVEDKINKYLPNFPNGENITIHHLLTHTSGIPSYNNFHDYELQKKRILPLDKVIEWIKQNSIISKPGENFHYSNSGYAMLAKIIEVVSGKSYQNFLNESFFIPLKMNQTGNYPRSNKIENRAEFYQILNGKVQKADWYELEFKLGSGSISSTAKNLFKWYKGLIAKKILKEKSLEKIFKNYGFSYGYGLGKGNSSEISFFEHEGSSPGVSAYIVYIIDPGYFLVILSNISSSKSKTINNSIKNYTLNYIYNKEKQVVFSKKISKKPK